MWFGELGISSKLENPGNLDWKINKFVTSTRGIWKLRVIQEIRLSWKILSTKHDNCKIAELFWFLWNVQLVIMPPRFIITFIQIYTLNLDTIFFLYTNKNNNHGCFVLPRWIFYLNKYVNEIVVLVKSIFANALFRSIMPVRRGVRRRLRYL